MATDIDSNSSSEMAFPVPSHLPRRAAPPTTATPAQTPAQSQSQDVTSKILSTMDLATTKSLTASVAVEWIQELDESMQETKELIHTRIQSSLPQFQSQLSSSLSIQSRLKTLTTQVDTLQNTLSSDKGLIPTLISSLTTHQSLSQSALNARIKNQALAHLVQCRESFTCLTELVGSGHLPEAVEACSGIERLLLADGEAGEALAQSKVFQDLRRKFRATKSRIEEQLSDAFRRCVVVSPTEFLLSPSIQVRGSERTLRLPEIVSSMGNRELDNHLNTLRRDITLYYFDALLTQPMEIVHEEYQLTCLPSPPNDGSHVEFLRRGIENLSTALRFLHTHFLVHLPSPQFHEHVASNATTSPFALTLIKPITSSLLQNLLIPNLPSSFTDLPAFLSLLRDAVQFEEVCVVGLLLGGEDDSKSIGVSSGFGSGSADRPVKTWADAVGIHYERKRRVGILEKCRGLILASSLAEGDSTFRVQVEVPQVATEPDVVSIQEEGGEGGEGDTWGLEESTDNTKVDEDRWGFDDDEGSQSENMEVDKWGFDDDGGLKTEVHGWGFDDEDAPDTASAKVDEDGWGFDDSVEEDVDDIDHLPASEPPPQYVASPSSANSTLLETNGHSSSHDPEEDTDAAADAWGLEDEIPADDANWDDDPWGEGEASSAHPPTASLPPSAPIHALVEAPIQPSPQSSVYSNGTEGSISPSIPKVTKAATRLEKLANKGKAKGKSSATSNSNYTTPAGTPILDSSYNSTTSTPVHNFGSPFSSSSPSVSFSDPTPSLRSASGNNTKLGEKRLPKVSNLEINGASHYPASKVKEREKEQEKETYLVSTRTKDILDLVRETVREGRELAGNPPSLTPTSSTPSSSPSSLSGEPGTTLFQTSTAILDLWRALYPVVLRRRGTIEVSSKSSPQAKAEDVEGPMRFSNDCLYLCTEIEVLGREIHLSSSSTPSVLMSSTFGKAEVEGLGLDLESKADGVRLDGLLLDRLLQCTRALRLLGDSWYGDAIEIQRQLIDTILTTSPSGTSNNTSYSDPPSLFSSTTDQDQYDICESAMNSVLQHIRSLSKSYKPLLSKSKYYTAIGSVTDAALGRVVQEITGLGDITEVESQRLAELCRILMAIEGLFVEQHGEGEQPSFVVAYVPTWLKFSYLSELLEASLADITYLFEEGALVDFKVEELSRLVKALFADTPLRSTTIGKIMGGHPGMAGAGSN